MVQELTTEQRRARLATITKWGLGLVGAAVISPFIFFAVKGLIGAAIALAVGGAIVTFAPVVAMKFANWKVKAIVAEAKENPIETLTNVIIVRRQAFKDFKEHVENAKTAEKNFAEKIREFKVKYPARAVEFENQLEAMQQLVSQKVEALKGARDAIKVAEDKLDEMKAYWEMSQEAQKANAAANMDTGDMYERLKVDTACDAVFESMNKAFAQVEVAAALETLPTASSKVPQLTHTEAQIIEGTAVKVKERVHA